MQLKQKPMFQCHILLEHYVLTSFNIRFLKAIHLIICSHEHKVRDHHMIQTQITYGDWVITFLNKIRINKDISKIHYENIYHIAQLNTIHIISPLYHLKLIFQSPIMLHMNHKLYSRCNNTYQFHNKQFKGIIQQLY